MNSATIITGSAVHRLRRPGVRPAKDESDKEDASSYAYQQQIFTVNYYVRCAYDDTLSSCHFRRDDGYYIAWFVRQ